MKRFSNKNMFMFLFDEVFNILSLAQEKKPN